MTNLKWFAALAIIAVSFAMGTLTGSARTQGKWNIYKLEQAENALKAAQETSDKEQFWIAQAQEARIDSNKWKSQADAYSAKWSVANGKLRDITADINSSMSKSTIEACNRVVNTYGDLLSQCDEEQHRMAQAADGCVAAYVELDGAWPVVVR